MTSLTTCVVCDRPSVERLCSLTCVREAVHEREGNVRRLRLLRRTGGSAGSTTIVRRNAELTGALLARRPAGGEAISGATRLRRTSTGTWQRSRTVA